MNTAENYIKLRQTLPKEVKIIAVSKRQEEYKLQEVYDAGNLVFGENQAQAMKERHEKFPKDIEWHFIGHLQTNKVKYIAPFVHLIHSVDSLSLLTKINNEAKKNDRVIDCLLQIKIAQEATKFGMDEKQTADLLSDDAFANLNNIRIVGVMGMASNTPDEAQIESEFAMLRKCFDNLKTTYFADKDYFKEISAGMSSDYEIAIKQGATMVRIGSTIFGQRNY